MPLDPALASFVPVPDYPEDTDFATLRVEALAAEAPMLSIVAEPAPEVAERSVRTIPVEGGSIDIAIFRPTLTGTLPVHLYFHGGGWVAGSGVEGVAAVIAAERAVGAQCVVVSVDYRLAPEHPAPVPLRDCQAALEWVLAHADEIGVDPSKITIGGGSAGANLAAALCVKLRDEHGPRVALQVLEVPALDLTLSLPSHSDVELTTTYGLHRRSTELMIGKYLGEHGDPRDPYLSPLFATDFTGLPPAYIVAAEFDFLRDDASVFAEKLRAAGVPVDHHLVPGQIHGSSAFTKLLASSREWRDDVISALRRANEDLPSVTGASGSQAV